MNALQTILKEAGSDWLTEAQLTKLFGRGAAKDNKLSRLVQSGDLIRLKRGLYILSAPYQRQGASLFKLANLIYGPSYVSLESALSRHGLIPEAVYGVTSVTSKRPTSFDTPLALFSYRRISQEALLSGVARVKGEGGSFFLATPEKALLDKLYLDCKKADLGAFLTKSLRIEADDLFSLDKGQMLKLSATYQNETFKRKIEDFVRSLV